jgi:multicomponent Na+:H+ antiporter subunit E
MSLQSSLKTTASAARFVFFISIWLAIANWSREDLPIGVAASVLAVLISLSLLPPTTIRPRLAPLVRLNLRFLSSSILAGVDVARRALLPRLDLNPGFVAVPFTLPPGVTRNTFLIYSSLQPGTLPTSAEGDTLQVHGLDILQPIAASIEADEDLFEKALGHE